MLASTRSRSASAKPVCTLSGQMQDWSSLGRALQPRTSLRVLLFNLSVVLLGLLLSSVRINAAPSACTSRDQPNPIATDYPNNATGVLNATLAILPIPLSTARKIVPPQWGILESVYRALLPDFPQGMYPVLVQAGHDHDIQFASLGLTIADFSKVEFEFPFIDLLGDGHSSFRWVSFQLITASNTDALGGCEMYGARCEPAVFDPDCDAYDGGPHGASYFGGRSTADADHRIELTLAPLGCDERNPFPLDVFKNITNQPSFGDGAVCDQQIRLFHTDLSRGQFAPVPVKGRVAANLPPLEGTEEHDGIFGVQVATPFIENNMLDCGSLRGYTGPGDLPGY